MTDNEQTDGDQISAEITAALVGRTSDEAAALTGRLIDAMCEGLAEVVSEVRPAGLPADTAAATHRLAFAALDQVRAILDGTGPADA